MMAADLDALQERYDFVLAACRDAQDLATRYGWALRGIADMDPDGRRADDLGRAARAARAALLGQIGSVTPMPCEECEHPTLCADFPDQHRTCGVTEVRAPLPRWEPCNEGCDPEFNGSRSRSCKCPAALAALGVPASCSEPTPPRGNDGGEHGA